jgi:hypothetical protein
MTVTPTSSIAIELATLRNMLGESQTFQEWTNTIGDPAEAMRRVHIQSYKLLPGGDGVDLHIAERPYAVVMRHGGQLWNRYAEGQQYYLRRRGELLLYLTANSSYDAGIDDALDFANFYGGVADDLARAAGTASSLPITDITIQVPASLNDRTQHTSGRYWDVMLSVQWL